MQLKRIKSNFNDKQLVKGCLNKDRLMQRALFEQYKLSLYSVAYRLLSNHEVANDVIQDAFIDIFGSLHNFKYKSTLYTWMRTIVVRTSITRIKEKSRLYIVSEPIPETSINDNFNFTAEHLEHAILSLPENARAVFLLIEVEGYKHKEVAEIMKITVGTSKSQLNYAKKILRRNLTPKRNEQKIQT